jgi:hypothetical protein
MAFSRYGKIHLAMKNHLRRPRSLGCHEKGENQAERTRARERRGSS